MTVTHNSNYVMDVLVNLIVVVIFPSKLYQIITFYTLNIYSFINSNSIKQGEE